MKTSIGWTDYSWNPLKVRRLDTGKIGWHCERISPGCTNCYAATLNKRNLPGCGTGLDYTVPNTDLVDVFLDENALMEPLRWKKPRRVFVCSMSDLFGRFVTDEMRDRIFAVMALCPQHQFQVLTKRAAEMAGWYDTNKSKGMCPCSTGQRVVSLAQDFSQRYSNSEEWERELDRRGWPLPNVWLGVSVESQKYADERIPHLLRTPAAVRWLSCEPLLEGVDLSDRPVVGCEKTRRSWLSGRFSNVPATATNGDALLMTVDTNPRINWVVVGGESGPGARPFNVRWARDIIGQCKAAEVPCFVKQLGSKPEVTEECHDCDGYAENRNGNPCEECSSTGERDFWYNFKDRKGSDPSEWPEDLRVQEWPS